MRNNTANRNNHRPQNSQKNFGNGNNSRGGFYGNSYSNKYGNYGTTSSTVSQQQTNYGGKQQQNHGFRLGIGPSNRKKQQQQYNFRR